MGLNVQEPLCLCVWMMSHFLFLALGFCWLVDGTKSASWAVKPVLIILFLSVVVYLIVLPPAPDTYRRKAVNPLICFGDE